MPLEKLAHQPRLAHARLADQCQDTAASGIRLGGETSKHIDLGLSADERGKPARRRRLQAVAHSRGAEQLEGLHLVGKSFDLHRAKRADLDKALHLAQSVGGQQNRSRARQRLHARRHMGGLAERRVVDIEIVGDRAHDHFAGVDAHADLQRVVSRSRLFGVAPHVFLHLESGIAGAHRMIFVREGRAEQRHDTVA